MGLYEAMIMFLAVLISLGFARLCAWLAKSRGRDPIIWGILGFFFNVLALAALLIIPKGKEGIHGNMKYLSVLLLAATAATVLGMVAKPSLAEKPNLFPTLEAEPDHHWQGYATAEQLDLIRELCGTEVNVGELLERISPQTLQELPENLVGPLYEEPVQWLGKSLDDSLVCGAIEAVLNNQNENGFQKASVFFYYIGSRSKETLHGNSTLSSEYEDSTLIVYSKEDVYRLSVYTGE